jgi:hypothetical protein
MDLKAARDEIAMLYAKCYGCVQEVVLHGPSMLGKRRMTGNLKGGSGENTASMCHIDQEMSFQEMADCSRFAKS